MIITEVGVTISDPEISGKGGKKIPHVINEFFASRRLGFHSKRKSHFLKDEVEYLSDRKQMV